MRILLLLAALPLLATFAPPALQHREPPPAVSLLTFTPVALQEKARDGKRLGRLTYLGGWALTSNDARIGGISALHVEAGEALALSDAGWRIRFPLPAGRNPVRAEVAMVEEGPGPPGDNAGPEAMVRLADGRFLVFAEGDGGDSEAILFAGDPAVAGTPALRLRYRPPAGYRVTDAAALPDGRLILLNRKVSLFEGFTARLTVAALPGLADRALIAGQEVAAFEGSATRDNFEALSVTRENGRTMLWIASDDNYNPFQRTLLMKFALDE